MTAKTDSESKPSLSPLPDVNTLTIPFCSVQIAAVCMRLNHPDCATLQPVMCSIAFLRAALTG